MWAIRIEFASTGLISLANTLLAEARIRARVFGVTRQLVDRIVGNHTIDAGIIGAWVSIVHIEGGALTRRKPKLVLLARIVTGTAVPIVTGDFSHKPIRYAFAGFRVTGPRIAGRDALFYPAIIGLGHVLTDAFDVTIF